MASLQQAERTEVSQVTDPAVTFTGYGVLTRPAHSPSHATPSSPSPSSSSSPFSSSPYFQPYSYHPRLLGTLDIEVEILCCGICASDIHTVTGGWGNCLWPCIPGHEIVGKVRTLGRDVKGFQVGDRVAVGTTVLSCFSPSCSRCSIGLDHLCPRRVSTYNSLYYPERIPAQGGYASAIRVHSSWVFHLPSSLPTTQAAPLLCAGITCYSPLKKYKAGENGCKRIGIIGLGGLGHLGIQFASKMGAWVAAIGTSKNKENDAKKFGASVHIDINNSEEYKSIKGTLDLILCTADAKGMNWDKYISLIRYGGTFVLLSVPEENLKIRPMMLLTSGVNLTSSMVGSRSDTKEMLEFAAKHGIMAMVEEMQMSKVNEGVKRVQEGKVRYRVVLVNSKPSEGESSTQRNKVISKL